MVFGLNLVELPAYKKDLPQCTAGYETWIMHHGSWIMEATLIEIGVYGIAGDVSKGRAAPLLYRQGFPPSHTNALKVSNFQPTIKSHA